MATILALPSPRPAGTPPDTRRTTRPKSPAERESDPALSCGHPRRHLAGEAKPMGGREYDDEPFSVKRHRNEI